MTTAEDLLAEADPLPFGPSKTILVEEALRAARESGDPHEILGARLALIACYRQDGEVVKLLRIFERCVEDYDAAPETYGPWLDYSLRWDYKWLTVLLVDFPEISLEQVYSTLDDMEGRYLVGGHSLQAVYQCRNEVARHIGQRELAEKWYAKWLEEDRDGNSDCEACEISERVAHLAWQSRDEEAVAVAEPVLTGRVECREQPQEVLTRLMLPYLRTGRHEAAVRAHRQAYRALRAGPQAPGRLGAIATHMEFCALTGNDERGLELYERHRGDYGTTATPGEQMHFAAASALVLRRLGSPLEEELHTVALKLAAKFDIRNNSSEQGVYVRGITNAEPIVGYLPISNLADSVVRLNPHEPTWMSIPEAPPPELIADLSPVQLLDAAEELWRNRRVRQFGPYLQRFNELVSDSPIGEPPARMRAMYAELRGAELLDQSSGAEIEGVAAIWETAAQMYAEAGDEARRQQALGRLGTLKLQLGPVDEGVALVEESTEYLLDDTSQAVRTSAVLRLARSYFVTGRLDEALELAEQAAQLGVHSGYPIDSADAAFFRAQVHAQRGHLEIALGFARDARRGYRDTDQASLVPACLLLGTLLSELEDADPAEIESTWSEAVEASKEIRELHAQVRTTRARWLVTVGRASEAARDLLEVIADLRMLELYVAADRVSVDLARAYLVAEQPLDAAETAEEVFPRLESATREEGPGSEADVFLGDCRLILAGAFEQLGEREAAAREFGMLARQAVERGEPEAAGEYFEAAGDLLEDDDLDEDAAEAFVAAADQFSAAQDPLGEVRCLRRRALSIGWSGSVDAALALLDHAKAKLQEFAVRAEPADRHGIAWEFAWMAYAEARMQASIERYDIALQRVEQAAHDFGVLASEGVEGAEECVQEMGGWRDALRKDLPG